MAIWYAQANSSNINGLNLWSSLPAGGSGFLTWANLSASDILIANAKTGISCNVGFTCATISTLGNFGGGTGTNGGNFTLPDSITIACNVVAGTSTCVTRVTSGGASTVTGNITGSAATATQYGFSSPGAGQTNITGNITGGAAANAAGILTASSGSVVVTGNVIGGTASYGISASGTGSVTVSGTVSGHATGNLAGGITASGTVTISVSGNVTAGANSNGIYSTSTAYTLFTAASTWTPSSVGYAAVVCIKPLIPSSGTVTHAYYTNNSGVPGTARSLYTGGLALGHPATANVRSGTVYGSTSEYTGTLLVPNPAYVSAGVGTDNTVGTLITYLNNPTIVSRSTNDANPITFSWPVSGATITGTVSLNTANYVNVTGAISYSRTEGSKYYYKIAHNSADRTTAEGTARYAFTDGTYTRYATLRITGSSSQSSLNTLDDYVDTEVAAIKAKTDQLTFTTANQVDSNALSGGAGLSAQGTRDALGMATANLDTQIATLATPTNITAATGITVSSIGQNVITALSLATDAVTEIQTGLATPTNITAATGITVSSIANDAITAPSLSAAGVTKIQTGLATPTNITAATGVVLSAVTHTGARIPNVTLTDTATNLTNSATNGDLTQTMKTSVTAAVPSVVSIQSGLATPTNITAGTITTVTNLTNAATSGDLTSTMKASVTAAVPSVVSIQSGLATPTNITAGTITTVTNLTNAPTSGDLTQTMKTSVAAAVTAAAPTVVQIQSGLATPTNITAGTITTVTNLTKAATSGDLTATMKSSVTTAVPTAAQNFAAVLTTAITESYAAGGAAPTLAQAILLIQQSLHEFAIASTTRTVKKLDGSTTAATFTLNSATAPTATTRAT